MIDYKSSGVDVTRGYSAVELMKKHTKTTFDEHVLGDLGSFGGFYDIGDRRMKHPVLVAGTDGVGTKLRYAIVLDKHDTIGIDCVAMCVNDVVCQGAQPLLFLDYIATGRIQPEKIASIVAGVSEGCRQAGCALIGGETAEMPGFYPEDDYDLAGFNVGIVDKDTIINGKSIVAGDVLIGLASSGIHSNGYSLVRKLFVPESDEIRAYSDELGMTIGEKLLTPTRIYVKTILEITKRHTIKGIAHITGGGFIENIPRILPKGIGAKVDVNSYVVPPIFRMLQARAGIDNASIYNTFNMGIGMVLAVAKTDADAVMRDLKEMGEDCCILGETVEGEGVAL